MDWSALIEVGQDATGEWAWMIRDNSGLVASAFGFTSADAALRSARTFALTGRKAA